MSVPSPTSAGLVLIPLVHLEMDRGCGSLVVEAAGMEAQVPEARAP